MEKLVADNPNDSAALFEAAQYSILGLLRDEWGFTEEAEIVRVKEAKTKALEKLK